MQGINPIEWLKKHEGWRVTSPYGWRTGKYAGYHIGTDLGGNSCGHPFRTPFGGRVVVAATSGMSTWGNTLVIEIAPGLAQLTAHHERLLVKVGDVVEQGQAVATNGGTTHTGIVYACHIHYEIRILKDGGRRHGEKHWGDPEKFYLDQRPQEPSTRFSTGDRIRSVISQGVRIRRSPGVSSDVLGVIEPGAEARIAAHRDNGIRSGGYCWWRIDRGWVAEDFFEVVLPPDPKPIDPPELVDPGCDGDQVDTLLRSLLQRWPELRPFLVWLSNVIRREGEGE